ncbi:MAG: hypothetical protein K2Q22_11295, partial [Cytophagales bacterium]|nr:hypothetical protein [Cytophagales bacterium]
MPSKYFNFNSRRSIIWLLFLFLFGWNFLGCLVDAPVENDGVRIGYGSELIKNIGLENSRKFCYRYDVQPGTFLINVGFQRLSGLNGFDNFSLISKVLGIISILIVFLIVSNICKVQFPLVGIIGFTFQELFINNYYPNSNSIAFLFYSISILILIYRKHYLNIIISGVLFGIAAIVGMLHPYALTEGVFFDGRSVVISLSAFFFGPV